ncbi:helix-turn-helix domain-containing protein [Pseudonocardia sp. KRD291]|uniref:ArsR/SmtB family transcription factor n=1 Tax=Pseudonocardia sp. KRD291 TaxID=2792007 RepID=UPI001C4A5B8A|nr:helix-turn-helix domain-containing protein [Pseudonocardia sp. KRD291]MBW0104891.1 helix-turn-helix transcriptional regulator [Pseudonocardia sp. KRD291]
MQQTVVISDPAVAAVALDPVRARILRTLAEPGSASTLAPVLGLSRQNVNHHLRALEAHGLVELVQERRRGNMTERVMQAVAGAFVVSPQAWALLAPDPDRAPDRLSAQWLLALGARLVRDVGTLLTGADRAGRRVATFAVDGEISFASPEHRAEFTRELADAVAGLVARHHDGTAEGARPHRLVVGLHPTVAADPEPLGPDLTRPDPTPPDPTPTSREDTR